MSSRKAAFTKQREKATMFVTTRKNEFRIHDDTSGNIAYIKSMPEEILDAHLSGDTLTITMPRRVHVLKRVGNTHAFSFFRELPR